MKFLVVFATLALAGTAVLGGPISVSDNNIGDIVTVGVNVQANVTTDIQSNIVNILVALLTQVGDLNNGPSPAVVPEIGTDAAPRQEFNLIYALNHVKSLTSEPGMTKEQKTQIWQQQVEAMVQQVLSRKE